MKIDWSFIEPVRDQATCLRGDFTAQSEIVKLAEQQAEIERLREENARLREALEPLAATIKGQFSDILFGGMPDNSTATVVLQLGHLRAARAAIREGGKDRYARG